MCCILRLIANVDFKILLLHLYLYYIGIDIFSFVSNFIEIYEFLNIRKQTFREVHINQLSSF